MLTKEQTATVVEMIIRDLSESFEEGNFDRYRDSGCADMLQYIVKIGKLIEALNLDLSLLQKKQTQGDE